MNKFKIIAKQIIPFVCDNPECRHEYDLESFRNAADYLGLIYLSRCEFGRILTKHGVEYNIIGITCPECWQTTLKQCHFPIKGSPKDYIYKSAQKDLSHNDLMTRVINIDDIKIHGISFFFNKFFFGHDNSIVPFSARILADLSLISREELKNAECDQKNKYIIDQTPILNYPKDILNELPYCFDELNIPTLLALENKRKFKIFPRFVSADSIYWYTDKWLAKSSVNEISFSSLKVMIDQFDYTLSFGCYKHNALTREELRKYEESPPPFERSDFEDYFPIFLNEYKLVRNKIDFEKIGYPEFIIKYARMFYPQMLEVSSEIEKRTINPPENESLVNEVNIKKEKSSKEEDISISNDQEEIIRKGLNPGKNDHKLRKLFEEEDPSVKDKDNVFMKIGDTWYIKYKGKKGTTLPDTEKIRYIAHLFASPNIEIINLDLINNVKGRDENSIQVENDMSTSDLNFHIEEDDLKRFIEIGNDLYSDTIIVEKTNNQELQEESLDKLEKYRNYMIKEYGIMVYITKSGLRFRVFGKSAPEIENARVKVANQIRYAIEDIGKKDRELKKHIRACIKTHTTYSIYDPNRDKSDGSISWNIIW